MAAARQLPVISCTARTKGIDRSAGTSRRLDGILFGGSVMERILSWA
jgi:hypothetical protein